MTVGAPKGILERACLRIIAFAALFVPWHRRPDWREEWESEVWHSLHPNQNGNGPKALSGAALLLRCCGALWHALWVEFKGRGEMGEIWRDFRMGFRVLVRSPMVTLAAVVTLALGIGGTTAVFSVADGVLFNPMNFPESNRLVRVSGNFSYDNLRDLQSESRTLESIGVYRGLSVAVTGWWARRIAIAEKRDTIDMEDVGRALAVVDRAATRLPALGAIPERARIRFLLREDGIARLIRAYELRGDT